MPPLPPSPRPGRPPRWCSQQCRRAAYEERRAAANGAIAVRVETIEKPVERIVNRIRYETKRVPATPAEAAKMVLTSPRACRHVLEGLAAKAEAGELDRGAHSSTLRAAEKLYTALSRKRLLRDRWLW